MNLTITLAGENLLADTVAFFDSYGVELTRAGKILLAQPAFYLPTREPRIVTTTTANNAPIPGWSESLFPEIDSELKLQLIEYASPAPEDAEDAERERPNMHRWPFYVESRFTVALEFGRQWWQFTFTPGNTYRERFTD